MKVGEKDGSSRSQYVEKLLNLYLGLPETGCRASRYDRQLADQLYEQKVEIETIEVAMVLASARRIYRDPSRAALGPIRSLHYFLPVVEEVLANPLPPTYVQYLRYKLASLSAGKPISK
jgi:hypothetical protein